MAKKHKNDDWKDALFGDETSFQLFLVQSNTGIKIYKKIEVMSFLF